MDIKISVRSEDVEPLADPSIHYSKVSHALIHVLETKEIASSTYGDRNEIVYIMTEQAYKYMLSKCTEDEAFDLGILGQSEQHMKSVGIPEKLKSLLNKFRK